jgi:phenylpropionate dioxygenase-like ring-hydroxylating dioxygenase large terminal subunit
MDRITQQHLVARVIELNDERTTDCAPHGLRIPAAHYVSEEHLGRERASLFRSRPVFACFSVDVPDPADYTTFDAGGVPVAVVRAQDGTVRAFVNVCRHRAASVVNGRGNTGRTFNCPFHGWVYDTDDGRLRGRPRSCDGFVEFGDDCLGLRELGAGERHGIVAVHPGSAEPVDVDAWLCGLGSELDSLHYASLIPYKREQTRWACNWKLLLDTFLESYHVPALHKISLAPFYLGIASPFDAYGPHNRIVVPQNSILDQRDRPASEWALLPYAVLQYFIAPNIIVSNLYGYVMVWRFVPEAAGVTVVEHELYTYAPAASPADREHFDQRFGAAARVTGDEDFPQSEIVHRNLLSGCTDHTIAGRNEPGMVHFHTMCAQAAASGNGGDVQVTDATIVGEKNGHQDLDRRASVKET